MVITDHSMQILIIPSWFDPDPDSYNGIFILNQAKALQRAGHSVSILYQTERYVLGNGKIEELKKEGIQIIHRISPKLPKLNLMAARYWARRYQALFEYYEKKYGLPDVVHCHSFTAGLVGAFLKVKTGIPFVLTEHYSGIINRDLSKRQLQFLRYTLDSADQIIAVSNKLAEGLKKYTPKKITTIPNCCDESIFFPKT